MTPDERYWPRLIANLRTREGLTQADLADRLGVDQTTISRWERRLDLPGIRMRLRLRDLLRSSGAGRDDRLVVSRVRHSAWPASLVSSGAVFLEINASALSEAGLAAGDLRGSSIYGQFGPEVDVVTERWERTGIFDGSMAMTISMNMVSGDSGPIFLRSMDTPHFTCDGEIWCLCEIRRIDEPEYHRLIGQFGASTFSMPFDALPM